METMLRALLASGIITLISLRSGVSGGLELLWRFAVYFGTLWLTFTIIKKLEERKKR